MPTKTLSLLALSFAFAVPALAQEETPEPEVTYSPETHVDFGELEITSTFQAPGLVMVGETPRRGFNPMITLRSDFNAEIDQSVDQVK